MAKIQLGMSNFFLFYLEEQVGNPHQNDSRRHERTVLPFPQNEYVQVNREKLHSPVPPADLEQK